jgi:hypothetical protein
MARGYLVNLFNIPPLIFKFQFNPDLIQEKKRFNYKDANAFGKWAFDKTEAGGFFGYLDDYKEFGPLLTATKPVEPVEGEAREFVLEFALDASSGPDDEGGRPRYNGSILPDLAILRSFMAPSWDLFDIGKALLKTPREVPCWSRPPECSLVFAGLSLSCVMTDLQIKHVAFQASGEPRRAEVTVTLKEQTFSFATVTDFATRYVFLALSYTRFSGEGQSLAGDLLDISPTLFSIFE